MRTIVLSGVFRVRRGKSATCPLLLRSGCTLPILETQRFVQTRGDLLEHLGVVEEVTDSVVRVVFEEDLGGGQGQIVSDTGVFGTHAGPVLGDVLQLRHRTGTDYTPKLLAGGAQHSIARAPLN